VPLASHASFGDAMQVAFDVRNQSSKRGMIAGAPCQQKRRQVNRRFFDVRILPPHF
jgi:hypothetical protein